MPSNYPLNELPDGELTDPEIRRLIHDVVRERFRVISDVHLSEWWTAKRRHEQPASRPQVSPVSKLPSVPPIRFPDYNPADLDSVYKAILAQARIEVLAIRDMDLTI